MSSGSFDGPCGMNKTNLLVKFMHHILSGIFGICIGPPMARGIERDQRTNIGTDNARAPLIVMPPRIGTQWHEEFAKRRWTYCSEQFGKPLAARTPLSDEKPSTNSFKEPQDPEDGLFETAGTHYIRNQIAADSLPKQNLESQTLLSSDSTSTDSTSESSEDDTASSDDEWTETETITPSIDELKF